MTAHPYGPHRPQDAPTAVEVYPPGPWTEPVRVPVPAAVLAQRERVNTLAHERVADRAALEEEDT